MEPVHFVLDFDGVLTDRHHRLDSRTLELLLRLAKNGHRVDIASGRSMRFLKKNLLFPLQKRILFNALVLDRFVFNAENGLEVLRFKNGKKRVVEVWGMGVDPAEMAKLRTAIEKKRFRTLTDENEKHHMLSLFAFRDKMAPRLWKKIQPEMDEAEALLFPLVQKIPNTQLRRGEYYLDVVNQRAEKHFVGVRIIAEEQKAASYVIVGDSPSDLLLAQPFNSRKKKYKFFFVGDPAKLSSKTVRKIAGLLPPVIHFSKERYNEGTRRILESFLKK